MAGIIKSKMAPTDDESMEDPQEEATETPQQEAAEPAPTGGAPADNGEDPAAAATEAPSQEGSAADADMPAGQPGQHKITADVIMARLHLQPAQKPQLQRIVVAGMKVMFSAQTHQMMIDQLKGPGPLAQKLGVAIAGLMGLLMRESNNSLPPQLIIPAGLVLLAHAADFLREANLPVDDKVVGDAINVFVATVLKQFNIDPDKVAAISDRGSLASPGAAPGAGAGTAPQPGAGAPPQPGGLIASAMPQGGQ